MPGNKDEYIVTSGGLKGQRGFLTRDEYGAIVGHRRGSVPGARTEEYEHDGGSTK